MNETLDPGIERLVATLEQSGFDVIRDESSGSFGDRQIELRDAARPVASEVRLTRDRGIWDVEIEVGGRLALARLPDEDIDEVRRELDRLKREWEAEFRTPIARDCGASPSQENGRRPR